MGETGCWVTILPALLPWMLQRGRGKEGGTAAMGAQQASAQQQAQKTQQAPAQRKGQQAQQGPGQQQARDHARGPATASVPAPGPAFAVVAGKASKPALLGQPGLAPWPCQDQDQLIGSWRGEEPQGASGQARGCIVVG
jgi:hypothetical protein